MERPFNPVFDAIPEEQIIYFNPHKKEYRNLETNNKTSQELLDELIETAHVNILNSFEDQFHHTLNYFKEITYLFFLVFFITLIGIVILEKVLKYTFSKSILI